MYSGRILRSKPKSYLGAPTQMDDKAQESSEEQAIDSLITIAVEAWRFKRVFQRLLAKVDAGESKRYQNQFDWFMKQVEGSLAKAGLRVVNVEGQIFDPGVAATPLNIEDFDEAEELIIDQMLEPIIMGPEGLVKTGTATLRSASK
jgi:molecular chaperone GrpE (heat shock protein)